VSIDGKQLETQLGKNTGWNWEYSGEIKLTKGDKTLALNDLTGFEGRCTNWMKVTNTILHFL